MDLVIPVITILMSLVTFCFFLSIVYGDRISAFLARRKENRQSASTVDGQDDGIDLVVTGYKAFGIGYDSAGKPILISPFRKVPWPSREQTASCKFGAVRHIRNGECGCGLYAYRSPTPGGGRAVSISWNMTVVAVVTAWGWMQFGDDTLRAEGMTIEYIQLSPTMNVPVPVMEQLVESLGERYGVNVSYKYPLFGIEERPGDAGSRKFTTSTVPFPSNPYFSPHQEGRFPYPDPLIDGDDK